MHKLVICIDTGSGTSSREIIDADPRYYFVWSPGIRICPGDELLVDPCEKSYGRVLEGESEGCRLYDLLLKAVEVYLGNLATFVA
jgi:hypothetical protein